MEPEGVAVALAFKATSSRAAAFLAAFLVNLSGIEADEAEETERLRTPGLGRA